MIAETLQSDWASVPASMLPISRSLMPTFSRSLRSTTSSTLLTLIAVNERDCRCLFFYGLSCDCSLLLSLVPSLLYSATTFRTH